MKKNLLLLSLLCFSHSLFATTVSLLNGNNFREDQGYEAERTTLTIENFGTWKYGDVFFYYDITDPFAGYEKNGSNQFFGGIAPTLSLSKATGKDFSFGIVKDVSLRAELENGSASGDFRFRNYFYGVQLQLEIPYFDFATFFLVARDNPDHDGVGYQMGGFWQITWDYGQWKKFRFMGFAVWGPEGDVPDEEPFQGGEFVIAQPQLLYDLGNTWGEPNAIELGIEYHIAKNRFLIQGADEYAVQAILKLTY